jgi:hypothetical protein
MIVQAITTANAGTGDVGKNDIVIQTPGGGSGDNSLGCRAQYGTNWLVYPLRGRYSCRLDVLLTNRQGQSRWRRRYLGVMREPAVESARRLLLAVQLGWRTT